MDPKATESPVGLLVATAEAIWALRSDLCPWRSVSGSALAPYHHEQHMR